MCPWIIQVKMLAYQKIYFNINWKPYSLKELWSDNQEQIQYSEKSSHSQILLDS